MKRLITSESVSKGHPDKVADQISDAILDAYLEVDPKSKVAVETMVKDNAVILGGEVKSNGQINVDKTIRDVVKSIGYTDAFHGFHYKTLTIINLIGKQSNEINRAVELDTEVTAGDQGFMTGFATNETPNFMPLGMYISKKIVDHVSKQFGLGPDAKSQVTIEESESGKRIHTILVSTMHLATIQLSVLRERVRKIITSNDMELSEDIFSLIDENTNIVVNPAGTWNTGGPVSDCGLTGRKIVVDQYGPYCPVGGGAFSGKDSSKCDRSGAYLARYIAKNIVASGIANKCKVEIAYMIGVAKPTSLNIDTFGDFRDDELLSHIIMDIFPMTPQETIDHFKLTRPIFSETAQGHFGNPDMSWEKTDLADMIEFKLAQAGLEKI